MQLEQLDNPTEGKPTECQASQRFLQEYLGEQRNPGGDTAEIAAEPDDSTDCSNEGEGEQFFASASDYDVGHWDHGNPEHAGFQPPRWVSTESEQNGFEAARILMNQNATDADRQRAARLILNSPNPEHAVWTANNGIPTEYGTFRNTYSDNLHRNNLHLTLNYATVHHPPQGHPTHAGYRPGYSQRVPASLTLGRR